MQSANTPVHSCSRSHSSHQRKPASAASPEQLPTRLARNADVLRPFEDATASSTRPRRIFHLMHVWGLRRDRGADLHVCHARSPDRWMAPTAPACALTWASSCRFSSDERILRPMRRRSGPQARSWSATTPRERTASAAPPRSARAAGQEAPTWLGGLGASSVGTDLRPPGWTRRSGRSERVGWRAQPSLSSSSQLADLNLGQVAHDRLRPRGERRRREGSSLDGCPQKYASREHASPPVEVACARWGRLGSTRST